jgi:regulator of RNase E activity RraA
MVGHAFPVAVELASAVPEVPYVGLLAALDAVSEGQVFVFPVDRGTEIAVWGELLSTACAMRGARGVLSDGMVRDVSMIREMGFPVFARGTLPVDINGRYEVVAHNVPARIDGVHIMPGDLIVADIDGCVVVPLDLLSKVTELVAEKTQGESQFRQAVAEGMSPSEAFAKFGVL